MSHIVEIKTEVRDEAAIRSACQRLGLDAPVNGTAELYSGAATGTIVAFPDWKYPVVFDLETGKANYDNYGGHWGEQEQLDQLLQMYAVEMAKIEARRKGHVATEQKLADGSIKVTINVGGAA